MRTCVRQLQTLVRMVFVYHTFGAANEHNILSPYPGHEKKSKNKNKEYNVQHCCALSALTPHWFSLCHDRHALQVMKSLMSVERNDWINKVYSYTVTSLTYSKRRESSNRRIFRFPNTQVWKRGGGDTKTDTSQEIPSVYGVTRLSADDFGGGRAVTISLCHHTISDLQRSQDLRCISLSPHRPLLQRQAGEFVFHALKWEKKQRSQECD